METPLSKREYVALCILQSLIGNPPPVKDRASGHVGPDGAISLNRTLESLAVERADRLLLFLGVLDGPPPHGGGIATAKEAAKPVLTPADATLDRQIGLWTAGGACYRKGMPLPNDADHEFAVGYHFAASMMEADGQRVVIQAAADWSKKSPEWLYGRANALECRPAGLNQGKDYLEGYRSAQSNGTVLERGFAREVGTGHAGPA